MLAIWRDEADAAFRVKLAETDTLVEGAVIDRYRLFTAEETEGSAHFRNPSKELPF